jgi:hypothetical protein
MLNHFVISDFLKQAWLAYLCGEFLNLNMRMGKNDRLYCPGFESRRRQEIFFLSERADRLWGPPSLLYNGHWGPILRDEGVWA